MRLRIALSLCGVGAVVGATIGYFQGYRLVRVSPECYLASQRYASEAYPH